MSRTLAGAITLLAFGVLAAGIATAYFLATAPADAASQAPRARKVAVLLVSHGSRSARWREMLLSVEESVRDRVPASGDVSSVRSAFMEYTEPSIATRLEEFDAEGYSDVIVVPLLLTVSSHSFDDIPTICGLKNDAASLAHLRSEGARIYQPRARLHLTPLLDFPSMLEDNVVRRAGKLSSDAAREGVVLVAYGDAEYDAEWRALMKRLQGAVSTRCGITCSSYAWCGHIVHYSGEPTKQAISEVLQSRERALVVPLLVAVDEAFQHRIIGGAVADCGQGARVCYVPDAILPEPALDAWIVEIARSTREKIEAAP